MFAQLANTILHGVRIFDEAYYLEVMGRITQKLASVA